MRYWALLGILGLAFLLQTTMAGFLAIRGVQPDLALATVVSLGLLFGPEVGLLGGALVGLLLDVVFGRFVGLHLLTRGGVGLLIGLAEQRVFKESLLLPLMAGFVSSLLSEGATMLILAFFGWRMPVFEQLRTAVLPGALYNAVITLLIYTRIYKHYRYLRPDPRGAIHFIRRR